MSILVQQNIVPTPQPKSINKTIYQSRIIYSKCNFVILNKLSLEVSSLIDELNDLDTQRFGKILYLSEYIICFLSLCLANCFFSLSRIVCVRIDISFSHFHSSLHKAFHWIRQGWILIGQHLKHSFGVFHY